MYSHIMLHNMLYNMYIIVLGLYYIYWLHLVGHIDMDYWTHMVLKTQIRRNIFANLITL